MWWARATPGPFVEHRSVCEALPVEDDVMQVSLVTHPNIRQRENFQSRRVKAGDGGEKAIAFAVEKDGIEVMEHLGHPGDVLATPGDDEVKGRRSRGVLEIGLVTLEQRKTMFSPLECTQRCDVSVRREKRKQ